MQSLTQVGRCPSLTIWILPAAAFLFLLAVTPVLAQDADAAGDRPPAGAPQGPPPAKVRLGEVRLENQQNRWEIVGRLREVRRSIVAAEVTGKIIEVPVDLGSVVQAGQTVLVRIDPVWNQMQTQAARAREQAAVAQQAEAQALLDKSRRDRVRFEELFSKNSTTQKELSDARANELADEARFQAAVAQLQASRSELERITTEFQRLTVYPPFDGIVVKKMVEVGQWATPGAPLLEIVSRGSIDAVIDVPERFIEAVTVGSSLEIIIEPLQLRVTGSVRALVPDAGNAARTFPVLLALDDMKGQLKPGMSLIALLPVAKPVDTLTVPRDAVLRTAAGNNIWISAGGIALPVPVEVLYTLDTRLAIRPLPGHVGPPLAPGTPVVVEGAEKLFPTQPLIPIP